MINLFAQIWSPEFTELRRLAKALWPEIGEMPMSQVRGFLNEKTGLSVADGPIIDTCQEFLPRLREMAAELGMVA